MQKCGLGCSHTFGPHQKATAFWLVWRTSESCASHNFSRPSQHPRPSECPASKCCSPQPDLTNRGQGRVLQLRLGHGFTFFGLVPSQRPEKMDVLHEIMLRQNAQPLFPKRNSPSLIWGSLWSPQPEPATHSLRLAPSLGKLYPATQVRSLQQTLLYKERVLTCFAHIFVGATGVQILSSPNRRWFISNPFFSARFGVFVLLRGISYKQSSPLSRFLVLSNVLLLRT